MATPGQHCQMMVNVFIAEVDGNMGRPPTLLVLPAATDAAMPESFRHEEWTFLCTTTAADEMLGSAAQSLQEELAVNGYAIIGLK